MIGEEVEKGGRGGHRVQLCDNVVDEVNVPHKVHDDRVQPAPVREVVPGLRVDADQVVVVQEDQVVAEEVHRVGDPGQGHRHPHEGVGMGDRGEGGAEGVHTGAKPQELPGDQ